MTAYATNDQNTPTIAERLRISFQSLVESLDVALLEQHCPTIAGPLVVNVESTCIDVVPDA